MEITIKENACKCVCVLSRLPKWKRKKRKEKSDKKETKPIERRVTE